MDQQQLRIVSTPLCPLHARPDPLSERLDEALCGWPLTVLRREPGNWLRVRTHYGYEGCVSGAALRRAAGWMDRPLLVVRGLFADVLAGPGTERPALATLPRGALAAPLGEAAEDWQPVLLPDGRSGWVRAGLLAPYLRQPPPLPEDALRARVTERAQSYLGIPYRWGGKSPQGIDCSGLTFMAWFFSGVCLYRDARLVPGYPARPIPRDRLAPADLLYFPGHIALYLGDARYIHSTAKAGSDGVVINSLDPAAPDYRPDLAESLLAVGSVFPLT